MAESILFIVSILITALAGISNIERSNIVRTQTDSSSLLMVVNLAETLAIRNQKSNCIIKRLGNNPQPFAISIDLTTSVSAARTLLLLEYPYS